MILAYLRSSMIGTLDQCQLRFFITYCLGKKDPGGTASQKGCAFHKLFELLALRRLEEQNHPKKKKFNTIFHDDVLGDVRFDECTPELLLPKCIEAHKTEKWKKQDENDIKKWVESTLAFNSGEYDPRKLNIIMPEQTFDILMEGDRFKYDYIIDGKKVTNNLRIRGTMDLVHAAHGELHLTDYKTGRRQDWATGEVKDIAKLQKDFQVILYAYACLKLFPQYDSICVTMYFARDGGPFSTFWGKSDMAMIEDLIHEKLAKIRRIQKPSRTLNFKCKWCIFDSMTNKAGESACNFFHKRVQKDGADAVFAKYGDSKKIFNYGTGGGKTEK